MENLSKMINKDTPVYELYDFIQNEMSFNKVVELYKLLDHKMKTLEDEARYECECSGD